jgi:hypothetical protein
VNTDWGAMLEETLQAIATAGGSAIVGAMATDGWKAVRARVAKLFGHGNVVDQAAAEEFLDTDARLVEFAEEGDRDRTRAELLPAWQVRLAEFLRRHPEAVAQVHALAPSGSPVQHNIATSNGTLYAVQGGDQHITNA